VKESNPVETSVIILSMSLNALSASVIMGSSPSLIRISAAIVFIISGIGAVQLLWVSVSNRLVEYVPEFSTIKNYPKPYTAIWILKLWFKLLVKTVALRGTEKHELLSGYLNVLIAFALYLIMIVTLFFSQIIKSILLKLSGV